MCLLLQEPLILICFVPSASFYCCNFEHGIGICRVHLNIEVFRNLGLSGNNNALHQMCTRLHPVARKSAIYLNSDVRKPVLCFLLKFTITM